jgi:hypothetical protein
MDNMIAVLLPGVVVMIIAVYVIDIAQAGQNQQPIVAVYAQPNDAGCGALMAIVVIVIVVAALIMVVAMAPA